MSQLDPQVRERTDCLDAAGNTTAAVGKGYAIGSAALVSLALYGAFLTRAYGREGTALAVQVLPDLLGLAVGGGLLWQRAGGLWLEGVGMAVGVGVGLSE